jgi:anti-anti-sigma factor
MINGLPVVTAPAEIDVSTADKLRTVLLDAAANGHSIIVMDLTGTRFCDSSGLGVLAAAHRRAQCEGGELRLVLPADGPVVRVLAITGLDRCIPCFPGLDQALAAPRPSHPGQPGRPSEETEPDSMLTASVAAGETGPVIILAGEADLTTAGQLSALITGQLADGIRHLTIDVSRLRFADSKAIQTLVLAAKALKERDGTLVLLDPQQIVARVLALIGADQMVTIRGKPRATAGPDSD